MPIQITITAETAAEANQLVQDLAGTMSNMNLADVPEKTEVSTIRLEPRHAPIQNPTQYQAPTQPMMQPMQQDQQVQQPTYAPHAASAPQQPPVQQSAPMQGVVPTTAQTYTMDQLAVAATQLMDAGKQPELVSLLNSFGVQALTALPKDQYGAFATALRQMGAKL